MDIEVIYLGKKTTLVRRGEDEIFREQLHATGERAHNTARVCKILKNNTQECDNTEEETY